MQVIKRDNTIEEFNIDKIIKAVNKAFKSCNKDMPQYLEDMLKALFSTIDGDTISIEEIQNKVEDVLMNNKHFDVAKSYIIYREKHNQARFIRERLDYMDKYSQSSDNAATSSETDANANVTMKNVANLEGEVYKTTNRIIQRQRMKDKLNELFPEVAKCYEEDLENHIIYAHDESSTPVLKNYTYSSKEVVEVLYNGKSLLLPLDLLYDIVDEPEVLADKVNVVYRKYPWHMYVKDIDNKYTKISALTKKKRHRDLIRVKTAFGEDLVVTDNHPMITDIDNINTTVEAKDSLGSSQYRVGTKLEFKGKSTIDFIKFLPSWVNYTDKFIKYQQSVLRRIINVDRKLGYIVGFFVGDGGYNNTNKCIDFTQKEKEVLETINDYIYEVFGIAGTIQRGSGNISDKYTLSVRNQYIFDLFRNYFKIQDKAQNKTLPYNILEFNEEFAKGCLEGLIDADGTIKAEDCTINIRLSSRACVLQCTYLFRHFGYSVGNSIQSLPFSNNTSYHTNYTIWGINATKRSTSQNLEMSFKVREKLQDSKSECLKYKEQGYCTITKLTPIEKESSFYNLNEYIYDITTESSTFCSNNILVHNCQAVSLYPLMLEGVGTLDGVTPKAPNNLDSFCGQFVNAAFLLASQCKGAVAFGSFFIAFNYYCVREWGENYYNKDLCMVTSDHCKNARTIRDCIIQAFQQCVWGINQPAGNRGYQSPFINFSYYDSNYFKALFEEFYYPDGTRPKWGAIDYLQRLFMKYLNKERLSAVIAMPVETMALLSDGNDIIDKEYKNFTAEMYAEGHSFFTYISDNPNGLSSCCRLRSEIQDNVFSFTNGLSGVMTGSCNVITLNLNRIIQDWAKEETTWWSERGDKNLFHCKDNVSLFKKYLIEILERVYKYHIAYKTMLYDMEEKGMLTASKAGYIYMKKLYSTIGLNGINEAAEFLNIKCSYNNEYKEFCRLITSTIREQNKLHSINDKKRPFLFNQEFVPAESLGAKNYNWDKEDGYIVNPNRVLYNSYFYLAHDNTSVLDKFRLHGKEFTETLDGGVGCHINLEEHLSKEQYLKLIEFAVKNGTSYFTFNIPNSECEDCHYIVKKPIKKCPKCNSENIKWYTRIIGYLRAIKNFGYERQIEASRRVYSNGKELIS